MKHLICLLLLATACAKRTTVENTVVPSDPLRENLQWQSSEPWIATNLVPLSTGTGVFDWILAYDQVCHSHVSFSPGAMIVSASAQTSSSQFTDISCSLFDGNWTWSANANGNLVLCQNAPNVWSCVTFK